MKLRWPCPGYPISVVDGELQDSDAHIARGGGAAIDIAAKAGTPVLAVHSGNVEAAGWLGDDTGYGVRYSWVDDTGVWRVLCCHFNEAPHLPYTFVSAGEVIGFVGSTGNAFGPHLHLTLSHNGMRVRPEDYLTESEPVVPDEPEPAPVFPPSLIPDYLAILTAMDRVWVVKDWIDGPKPMRRERRRKLSYELLQAVIAVKVAIGAQ